MYTAVSEEHNTQTLGLQQAVDELLKGPPTRIYSSTVEVQCLAALPNMEVYGAMVIETA